ncbi:hypothetical protein [Kribbella deserti]|uniref:PASTA domain-containing protein n=1 Tax=Kribbella deserti TaxID=1926257 RepID=A0ABV6QEV4_9ACTN
MTTIRLIKLAVPVLAVAVFVTACGGNDKPAADDQPGIATLDTPTPGKSTGGKTTPAKKGESERPRERIDMTNAERTRMYEPYLNCLNDHGVTQLRGKQTKPGILGDNPAIDRKKKEAAGKACESKLPLPAWEIDSNNPDALEFARKVVACLKAKGVKYVEVAPDTGSGIVGPSLGGKNNHQPSITKGLDLMPECQREVAGK